MLRSTRDDYMEETGKKGVRQGKTAYKQAVVCVCVCVTTCTRMDTTRGDRPQHTCTYTSRVLSCEWHAIGV